MALLNDVLRSRLQPVIGVRQTPERRLRNITTYLRHRVTNAATESTIAKSRRLKYLAQGCHHVKNFTYVLHFYSGGLGPAPAMHPAAGAAPPLLFGVACSMLA